MNKVLVTLGLVLVCSTISWARVRVPYCTDCMYVVPVADLPDIASFYSEEHDAYVDLGFVHKQLWLLWVPIWNYEGQYALTIKDKDVYFDLSEDELKKVAESNNLELAGSPISLWNKIGGKAIILLVIVGGIWAYSDKKEPSKSKSEFINSNEGTASLK